jgi:hypothetical protein
MVTPSTPLARPTVHTLRTTILKGIMTGVREIRRVIGQAEVNFMYAGKEETDRLSRD